MSLNLRCATEGCPKNLEHRGGHFIYSREDRCFYCEDCFSIPKIMNDCAELYNFTTTHLNGEKIHVQGKQHLMRLERQYGVSHQQLNNMERNWDQPSSHRPEPMHPELERLMGKAREMGHEPRGRVSGGWNETHR